VSRKSLCQYLSLSFELGTNYRERFQWISFERRIFALILSEIFLLSEGNFGHMKDSFMATSIYKWFTKKDTTKGQDNSCQLSHTENYERM
jgi:hypothetical protein